MQINGQPVLTTQPVSVLEQLSHLPSGIVRTRKGSDHIELPSKLASLKAHAQRHVTLAVHNDNKESLHRAVTHLQSGLEIATEIGKCDIEAYFAMMLGEVTEAIGDKASAASFYVKSIKAAQSHGLRNIAATSARKLYVNCLRLHGGVAKGFAQSCDELTLSKMAVTDSLLKGSFYEGLDYEAAPIAQREYGISDNRKIGTTGVGSCGIIVLRNPETNWTSLAHIDNYVSPENIKEMLDGQPDGPAMPLLEAALWGMNLSTDLLDADTHFLNLDKIIKFLLPRNINVVSAHILDADGPSMAVVDPQTGVITEAGLMGETQRLLFQQCGARLNRDFEHLTQAFNIVGENTLDAYFLTHHQACLIERDSEIHTEQEIFCDFMSGYPLGADEQGIYDVYAQQVTYDANVAASNMMMKDANLRLAQTNTNGAQITPDQRRSLYEALRVSSKFIGDGSEELNKKKTDLICSKVSRAVRGHRFSRLDLEQLASLDVA